MVKTGVRKPCRGCGKMIDTSFTKCFSCGADQRGFFARYYIVVGLLISLLIGGAGGSVLFYINHSGSTPETAAVVVNTETSNDGVSTVTAAEDTASEMANIYATTMHMSKRNVSKQLVSEYGESLSEETLAYAMNSVKIDWKLNALECARLYNNGGVMTTSEIYAQLIDPDKDWFTEDEARYAIENLK